LGTQLRAQRKALKVNATVAAEAAGISRVTLHRIEKGEPSVTMGAWANVAAALGMQFNLEQQQLRYAPTNNSSAKGWWPVRIALADYPQLWRYLHCLALWRIPRVGRHRFFNFRCRRLPRNTPNARRCTRPCPIVSAGAMPLQLARDVRADRQADDGVFSRGLIDLAMLNLSIVQLRAAVDKASQAYGLSICRDLAKAIDRAEQRVGWLDRCMQAMAMETPKALVWQKIRNLRRVLPSP
jgi:DNA-binding XRE family transcriptional regulator